MKLIDILAQELPKRGGWPEGRNYAWQDETGEIRFDTEIDCDFFPQERVLCEKRRPIGKIFIDVSDSFIVTREQYEATLAAKNDGWIDWGGGDCPVPRGTLADVRYRNGEENHHVGAGLSFCDAGSNPDLNAEDWSKDDASLDIIAYRLHQSQEAEQTKADDEADLNECIGQDAAPVWNGEGLPPVGCEFEYGSHRTKAKCLAVAHHMVFASKGNPDDEESDYEEFMISILDSEFHRVRTEAERKRDEAVKTIMLTGWCQPAAEEIYDLVAAGKVPGMKLED